MSYRVMDTFKDQTSPPDLDPRERPGGRRSRRFTVGAFILAGALLIPIILIAAAQILDTPEPRAGDRPRTGSASGVAMSSPVDPDAQFYWQLDEEPESLIPLGLVISGGPSPDGIPPIDAPTFETVEQAGEWLEDPEPVMTFENDGVVRAYPIQIMMWHEIVNDVVGDDPVTVSFCPLCNSAIVYDRRVADLVVDFGTSGRLYNSDLVMYDRQTKSMWPQIEGRAVVGPLIGEELTALPSAMVSWEQFRATHPDAEVLSRNTGFSRPYGENPYTGYDSDGSRPFLFRGDADDRLEMTERVLTLEIGEEAKAYPFSRLAERPSRVVHDTVGDRDVVIFFSRGTASALDDSIIAEGRDVGATGVFDPVAPDGMRLRFEIRDDRFVDTQTGSTWSLLGKATKGPLAGTQLERVNHTNTFWFAWAAFKPDTVIWPG